MVASVVFASRALLSLSAPHSRSYDCFPKQFCNMPSKKIVDVLSRMVIMVGWNESLLVGATCRSLLVDARVRVRHIPNYLCSEGQHPFTSEFGQDPSLTIWRSSLQLLVR